MSDGKNTETIAADAAEHKGNRKLGAIILSALILAALICAFICVRVVQSMRSGVTNKEEEKKLALPAAEIKPDITVELPGKVKLELIKVAAGSFEMSRKDKSNFSDEKPHQVALKNDFYIGRTEVTQAQYLAVMGADPSKFKGADMPVEQVSWSDALAFCEKLNALKLAPAGWKFTLPTEAQWEYAARGGSKDRKCKYSGSDELEEVGWYGDSGKSKDKAAAEATKGTTHPVAKKKANELGLYDMSGNVWEWTLDDYLGDSSEIKTPEARTVKSDPKKQVFSQYRTVRGGSWSKGERYCRNAQRYYYNANYRFCNIGFRVALVKAE